MTDQHYHAVAATLVEALPYMRRFAGSTFVIKYGGNAMVNDELRRAFAEDVVFLHHVGIHPVVVHGGGPQIKAMLDRLKIKSQFIEGLRVTDAATVEIVEMVLAGSINKQIVSAIQAAGGQALGLSGKDGNLIEATKLTRTRRDPESHIEQVLDRDGHLISELSAAQARALIADGTVSGGMIPKLETCLQALDDGVGAAHVLDGRLPHVLLLETFTEGGVGTKIAAG